MLIDIIFSALGGGLVLSLLFAAFAWAINLVVAVFGFEGFGDEGASKIARAGFIIGALAGIIIRFTVLA